MESWSLCTAAAAVLGGGFLSCCLFPLFESSCTWTPLVADHAARMLQPAVVSVLGGYTVRMGPSPGLGVFAKKVLSDVKTRESAGADPGGWGPSVWKKLDFSDDIAICCKSRRDAFRYLVFGGPLFKFLGSPLPHSKQVHPIQF